MLLLEKGSGGKVDLRQIGFFGIDAETSQRGKTADETLCVACI